MILENVNFKIEEGKSTAILGRNGTGKSTFLRAISGVHKIDSGEVTFRGVDICKKEAQLHIGYVPQEDIVFEDLTVLDNLLFWGSSYGIKKKDAINANPVIAVLEIGEYMNKKVSQLSGGMKKRLCIASSILHNPELLILDEPFSGIDSVAKKDMINYLLNLKKAGKTFVITSHNAEELTVLCERFCCIADKNVADATTGYNVSVY